MLLIHYCVSPQVMASSGSAWTLSNKACNKNSYTVLRTEGPQQKLPGKQVFSQLDLHSVAILAVHEQSVEGVAIYKAIYCYKIVIWPLFYGLFKLYPLQSWPQLDISSCSYQ